MRGSPPAKELEEAVHCLATLAIRAAFGWLSSHTAILVLLSGRPLNTNRLNPTPFVHRRAKLLNARRDGRFSRCNGSSMKYPQRYRVIREPVRSKHNSRQFTGTGQNDTDLSDILDERTTPEAGNECPRNPTSERLKSVPFRTGQFPQFPATGFHHLTPTFATTDFKAAEMRG